jgi:WD40 repeat protein
MVLQILEGYIDSIKAIIFSPDSKIIALVLNNSTVRLWDIVIGIASHIFKDYTDSVKAVTFSLNNKIVVLAKDYIVRLWDIMTWAAS